MSTQADEEARDQRVLIEYATTTEANLYTLLGLPDPFTPVPTTSTTSNSASTDTPPPPPTDAQIKKAYRATVLIAHPDKVPDADKSAAEARFYEVNRAYEVLKNTEARKKYDSRRQAEAAEKERMEKVSGARRKMAERLEAAERRASGGAATNGSPGAGVKRGVAETEEERKTRELHRFATEQARKRAEWEEKRRVKIEQEREAQTNSDGADRPSSLFSTPSRGTPGAGDASRTLGFSFTPKASPLANGAGVTKGSPGVGGSPSLYESTMAKLKEAERKRKEREREKMEKEIKEMERVEEKTAAVG